MTVAARTRFTLASEPEPATEDELADLDAEPRPRVRADCLPGGINAARPCVWVSCRHNLALEITRTGAFILVDGWENKSDTCALDVAARDTLTLEGAGQLLGLTRERLRQIEERSFSKLAARFCPECQVMTRMRLEVIPQPHRWGRTTDIQHRATCPDCGATHTVSGG